MKRIILLQVLVLVASFSFSIGVPTLSSPSNGATNLSPNVSLNINSVSGATSYDFEIDENSDFSTAVLINKTNTSCPTSELLFGQTYYWRARAKNATETSDWSASRNYTVINTVYLSSPSNDAIDRSPNVALSWNTFTGLTHYDYQYDTSPTFDSEDLVSNSVTSNYSSVSTTNLKFGTTYYWRVRARHSVGESGWSEVRSFTTINTVYLSSPSNNSTNRAVNQTISWNSISGLTHYDYQYDIVSTFDSENLVSASVTSVYTSVSTANLKYGTTYFWRVKARHTVYESDWSTTWSFTTSPLGAWQSSPANGSTGRGVSLTLSIDKVSGNTILDYQLDTVPTFDSESLQEFTHNNSYSGQTVNNLRYGQTYYWRVRGRNDNDISNWSTTWSFTTSPLGAWQSSPANGSTGRGVSLTLSIDKVSGNTILDYQLDTVLTFDSESLQEFTHNNSYSGQTVNSLHYGQTYYWRVRGSNDNDISDWSETWNFTTNPLGAWQSSPANGSTGRGVSLTLSIDKLSGNTILDYQLDTVPTFDSENLQEFTHNNSYSGQTVNSLRYGQTYYWRVRGRNDNGISEWSVTWSFTTNPYGAVQSTPANNATNRPVNLTLYVTTTLGSTNIDYQLDSTLNFNSPLLQELTHTNSYSGISVSNLRYGQTYYWRVRGRHASDISEWTIPWAFTTQYELTTAPTLSTPANSSTGISYSSINFTWNSISNANNYQYQVAHDAQFTQVVKTGNTALTFVNITNLLPSTVYYWRVRGENVNGYSPWSVVWNFTTESTVLSQPNLQSPENEAIITNNSLTFSWNSVFGANGYTLQVSIDNTFETATTSFTTSNTTYGISGLQYNLTYYWRVLAYDGSSNGPWSAVWSFSAIEPTLDAPTLALPTNEATGVETDGVTLQWNSVTNANSYTLQVSTESNFGNFIFNGSTASTSQVIDNIGCEITYYWRVRASNSQVTSPWSEIWQFTTEDCPIQSLDAPILILPLNQAENIDVSSITFSWNSVNNATSYSIEISTDSEFSSNDFNSTTNQTLIDVTNLVCNQTYFWRVKASNSETDSEWSAIWQFTTTQCTGDGLTQQVSFDIFPNPAKNSLYIIFSSNESIITIEFVDLMGRVVSRHNAATGMIDISNLNAGTYLVVAKIKNTQIGYKKLIKLK